MHTSGQNSQRVEKFLGLCDTGTLGAVAPKGATIRLRGCRNARVDGIKVEVQVKLGMFKQTLCQVVASPSLGCFLRLVIMSNWEDFTYPILENQKLLVKSERGHSWECKGWWD